MIAFQEAYPKALRHYYLLAYTGLSNRRYGSILPSVFSRFLTNLSAAIIMKKYKLSKSWRTEIRQLADESSKFQLARAAALPSEFQLAGMRAKRASLYPRGPVHGRNQLIVSAKYE